MVYIKLTFTAIFWGGTFIAGRILAQQVDPFNAAFLRFALATLMLWPLVYRQAGRLPALPRSLFLPVGLLGMTGVLLYNILFLKGLKIIYASRAALIIATNPILISLFAVTFLKERLTWLKVTGILLSVIGASLVISQGDFQRMFAGHWGRGELYILGCVACWSGYSLLGNWVMRKLSPLVVVAYSATIGAAGLFILVLMNGLILQIGHYSGIVWLSLGYLAFFGTVLGFWWYYQGIQKIGPTRASLFINLVPVSAIILAAVILDESITGSVVMGGLSVLLGVYLTNRARPFPLKKGHR